MLTALELNNFRSFANERFSLSAKTAVMGQNGSGKSTLIEAIRLLSVGKSFRTSRLDEAIAFDQPYFRLISGSKNGKARERTIELFYGQAFAESAGKDRILNVDGKATAVLDFVGTLPSVLFVPSDVEIIFGLPSLRRRYLDGIIWQVSAAFRQDYLDLNRVLKERSALLFLIKINRAGQAELSPWDELLTNLAKRIREARQNYIGFINDWLGSVTADQKELDLQLTYSIATEAIESVRTQEIQLSQNLFGPHRDELEIGWQGRSARKYASRGQARTAVILLKAGEAVYLDSKLNLAPLILLDDMFSELDKSNSQLLFAKLPSRSQVIATTIRPQPLLKDYQELMLP